MDLAYLLNELSKPVGKEKVLSLASQCGGLIPELLKLSGGSNAEVAFRASWVLETVALENTNRFQQYIDEFIKIYLFLQNQSCQRHFTNIVIDQTNKKVIPDCLQDDMSEALVETTFGWMIDSKTPVAVRVNCMDILYALKNKEDWIADELRSQIEFQLQSGSAGIQSRGRKVLRKLVLSINRS